MSQVVRGVISRKKSEPVEVANIVVPNPGPGEVVVDIIACGVCHTDLTYRNERHQRRLSVLAGP